MVDRQSTSGGRPGSRTAHSSPVRRVMSPVRWGVTHPWPVLLLAGVVVFGIWIYQSRQAPSHQVRAVFAQAPGLYSGEDVQVDGLDAGKVTSTTYKGGKAIVGIGISDNQYWPLHRGTSLILRFGTTIGNGSRFVQLNPGPASAPVIPQGGTISESESHSAVEFDQIFNVFNGSTRTAFDQMAKGMGNTLGSRSRQIGAAIDATGPGLSDFSGFTGALASDSRQLSELVSSGSHLTSSLASTDPEIESLVSNAATTFHALAGNTSGITGSLDRAPGTFTQVRASLQHVDVSLGYLTTLVRTLRPGAVKLRTLSTDLLPAMSDLRRTVPVADDTFAIADRTAPTITALLRRAESFSGPASDALATLAPMVACIRPYAPEIAGLLSTWSSFTQPYDSISHYARLLPMAGLSSVTSSPLTPELFTKLSGDSYALVEPPGYADGQPQLDPSCGITAAGMNPADDNAVAK